MIVYLFKMVLCSSILLLVYYLMLEKEKMHHFNRYYLLLSLIISGIVPLIEVQEQMPTETDNAITESVFYVTENTFKTVSSAIEAPTSHIDILPILLLATYLLISTILLIRFATNLFQIWLRIRNSETVLYQKTKLVLLPQSIVSHSFLKYIFVANEDYAKGAIDEGILYHEQAHVQQKHSFDILFVEVLIIVFWFNPFIYLYKKAIQTNHEFLADTAALKKLNDIATYQYLLLAQVNKPISNQFTSQFNFQITKKRLLMMNKTTSFTKALVKQFAIIPIIGSLIFILSTKTIAQDTLKKISSNVPPNTVVDKPNQPTNTKVGKNIEAYFIKRSIGYSTTNASDELMKEYATIVNKYKKDTSNMWQSIFRDISQQDKSRLITIFKQMSIQQQLRQNVVFQKSLGPFNREVPTETQLNSFKKASVYGVWIDDKRVANDVLNKYSNTDFAHVFISKLYGAAKKGRSYTHQVDLMTKDYYQKYYNESMAKIDEPMMVTRFVRGVTTVK